MTTRDLIFLFDGACLAVLLIGPVTVVREELAAWRDRRLAGAQIEHPPVRGCQ